MPKVAQISLAKDKTRTMLDQQSDREPRLQIVVVVYQLTNFFSIIFQPCPNDKFPP